MLPVFRIQVLTSNSIYLLLRKRRVADLLIKMSIAIVLVVVLCRQVWLKPGAEEMWGGFLALVGRESWLLMAGALVLMPANWILEAWKWRLFFNLDEELPLRQATRAVLAGVTLSMLTPNRIGDYGGRVLLVPPHRRWRAVAATLAGGVCQWIVLVGVGIVGFLIYARQFVPAIWAAAELLIPLQLLVLSGVIWFFPRLGGWISRLLSRVQRPWLRRMLQGLEVLSTYRPEILLMGLGVSGLRYAIYTLQYYLLLRYFGVGVPPEMAFAGIASIFFVQTAVPMPPVVGLLARTELALLIWMPFSANEVSILAATFSLFVINLVIPSLLGLGIIVKTNIIKSIGYENRTA